MGTLATSVSNDAKRTVELQFRKDSFVVIILRKWDTLIRTVGQLHEASQLQEVEE